MKNKEVLTIAELNILVKIVDTAYQTWNIVINSD